LAFLEGDFLNLKYKFLKTLTIGNLMPVSNFLLSLIAKDIFTIKHLETKPIYIKDRAFSFLAFLLEYLAIKMFLSLEKGASLASASCFHGDKKSALSFLLTTVTFR